MERGKPFQFVETHFQLPAAPPTAMGSILVRRLPRHLPEHYASSSKSFPPKIWDCRSPAHGPILCVKWHTHYPWAPAPGHMGGRNGMPGTAKLLSQKIKQLCCRLDK